MSGRYLPDVIKQLLAVIPEDQKDLRGVLESTSESASFASPELQPHWWRQAIVALSHHIKNPPFNEWQTKVIAILRDH